MTRAHQKGALLRRKLGLTGRVDTEAVANIMGFKVTLAPMEVQTEIEVGGYILVAERLGPEWRRWYTAHSLGHKVLHPGNQLRVYRKTMLGSKLEREANDFAHALLMDGREAIKAGLTYSWEVAEHFGVPNEVVWLQAPLVFDWGADGTTQATVAQHPDSGAGSRTVGPVTPAILAGIPQLHAQGPQAL